MTGYTVVVNGKRLDELSPKERAAFERRSRLREMLASGQPPRVRSDDTFRAGLDAANGKQFERDPHVGDYYRGVAEAAGVSTTGKAYLHGLAAFPGDPRAWVDGRGDVARVCEERGWECEGAVRVKPRGPDRERPKPPPLAEDIVQDMVEKELEANPDQRIGDVREKVIDRHAPHWSK